MFRNSADKRTTSGLALITVVSVSLLYLSGCQVKQPDQGLSPVQVTSLGTSASNAQGLARSEPSVEPPMEVVQKFDFYTIQCGEGEKFNYVRIGEMLYNLYDFNSFERRLSENAAFDYYLYKFHPESPTNYEIYFDESGVPSQQLPRRVFSYRSGSCLIDRAKKDFNPKLLILTEIPSPDERLKILDSRDSGTADISSKWGNPCNGIEKSHLDAKDLCESRYVDLRETLQLILAKLPEDYSITATLEHDYKWVSSTSSVLMTLQLFYKNVSLVSMSIHGQQAYFSKVAFEAKPGERPVIDIYVGVPTSYQSTLGEFISLKYINKTDYAGYACYENYYYNRNCSEYFGAPDYSKPDPFIQVTGGFLQKLLFGKKENDLTYFVLEKVREINRSLR